MPTSKYADTFMFTLRNLVPRKNIFFINNWFWLMFLPAPIYPTVHPLRFKQAPPELCHTPKVEDGVEK